MARHRPLPLREQVFILSLARHGYQFVTRHHRLKKRKRYIIPATAREDASGIDFWVKPAKSTSRIPVQITQRGTKLFQKYHKASEGQLADFLQTSRKRLRDKRRDCRRAGVAFVLIRDHDGTRPSRSVAWGDVKALHNGIASYITQRTGSS